MKQLGSLQIHLGLMPMVLIASLDLKSFSQKNIPTKASYCTLNVREVYSILLDRKHQKTYHQLYSWFLEHKVDVV